MLPEETLEQGMDAVDLVQGVLGIRQSLGLARWMNLTREAETLNREGMGIVAVVDESRAIPSGKDDAILASIEGGEDLSDPRKADGIPAAPRGGGGMEFE